MRPLTKRQREILDFVEGFQNKKGFSPSFREIMHHFQFRSLGTVVSHIDALKKKGALEQRGKRRGLALRENDNNSLLHSYEIPFVGMIQDRFPIELYKDSKTFFVPKNMVRYPEMTYLLQVQGESLESESMINGDLLIIEARSQAEPGELIIAKVGVETHIKTYFREGRQIRLESKAALTPLLLREGDLMVQGVIIGLLRLYG